MTGTDEAEFRWVCRSVEQRRAKRPVPERMGEVVSRLLAKQGYARIQDESAWCARWQQVVGKDLAHHSRPGALKGGVLHVVVQNSAVLQELRFQERMVLSELRKLVPEAQIRSLRFRIGELD